MTLNIKNIRKSVVLACLATSLSAASAYGADDKPPLDLETVGSFFAGGKTIHADNPCMPGGFCSKGGGDIRVQQVRVDFMIPKKQRRSTHRNCTWIGCAQHSIHRHIGWS